jgi:hypothetical protein
MSQVTVCDLSHAVFGESFMSAKPFPSFILKELRGTGSGTICIVASGELAVRTGDNALAGCEPDEQRFTRSLAGDLAQ